MTNSNSYLNLRAFSSVMVFLFGLFLSIVTLSNASTTPSNNVESNICPTTSNPSFCASVLKSAGTTDLKALTTYILNLARTNAGKSMTLAKSLSETTGDSQFKNLYLSCSERYEDAMSDIENAQNDLATGDVNGLNLATSDAMSAVDDCQDSFKQPLTDPSLLPKNGKTLKDICSIILVISNLLPGPI